MNRRRITLITALAAIGNVSDSVDFGKAAETYSSYLSDLERHEGKVQVARLGKELHRIASRFSVGHSWSPLSFRKSDKQGFPRALMPLKPWLSGSPSDKRFALTVTRTFESVRLKPDVDWSKITAKGPNIDEFLNSFGIWAKQWVSRVVKRKPNLQRDQITLTLARGPNGNAIPYAHYDGVALIRDQKLLSHLVKLASLTGNQWLLGDLKASSQGLEPPVEVIHSRIALLPEPGGKTRLIAIGDFWSQQILQPIHDYVMGILRNLETDGTHNQDKAAMRMAAEARECAFSFDLVSATDRFPISVQRVIVECLFGRAISEEWQGVMTDRKFRYKDKDYEWGVGQPLGFLSSWAVFALTHHAIIEYSAFLENNRSFRQYTVLGDDVVIWDRAVANRYSKVMESLGVEISPTKSIRSEAPPVAVEYAKRLFCDGVEITGISFSVLDKAAKSLKNFAELHRVLKLRSYDLDWAKFQYPSFLNEIGKELLSVVLFYLKREAGSHHSFTSGGKSVTFSFEELLREINLERVKNVYKLKETVDQLLCSNKGVQELMNREGISYLESSIEPSGASPSVHPWTRAINATGEKLFMALSCFLDNPDLENPVMPVEYLPIPSNSKYVDRESLHQHFLTQMVWKAVFRLLAKANGSETPESNHHPEKG